MMTAGGCPGPALGGALWRVFFGGHPQGDELNDRPGVAPLNSSVKDLEPPRYWRPGRIS